VKKRHVGHLLPAYGDGEKGWQWWGLKKKTNHSEKWLCIQGKSKGKLKPLGTGTALTQTHKK